MKTKKIFIVLIMLMTVFVFNSFVYASDDRTITQLGQDWIETGEGSDQVFNTEGGSKQGFLDIAGLIQGVGIFIAVGVGIILGIKFMVSSADGKAEIKKLLTPYLIGVTIVVGALLIWKIAIEIVDIS